MRQDIRFTLHIAEVFAIFSQTQRLPETIGLNVLEIV